MVGWLVCPGAAKVGERPGGYSRRIVSGYRKGDGAEMAMVEVVDYNEVSTGGKVEKSKSKRTRRGRKKAATAPATSEEE